MPNFHVNFYLSDEDYIKYTKDKKKYNAVAVEAMKEAVRK